MDNDTTDPAQPLENIRHERFAVLYSGECFGNASKAYQGAGYRPKCENSVRIDASRLLTNANIMARISFLRSALGKTLAIDCTRILELRLQIAYDRDEQGSTRLQALRDVERALGLEAPQRIEQTGSILVIEKSQLVIQ